MERAILTINKSFYFTAGKKYGFSFPECGVEGLGINIEILQNYKEIEVIVDGIPYLVDCDRAIAFIKRFKSVEDRKGVMVGIISRSLLKELNPVPKEISPTVVEKPILQSSMF